MISITSYYGNSPSSENNAKVVRVGNYNYYFSYETLVAVEDLVEHTKTVRHNEWGPTTGSHLNTIDGGDKANRLSGEEFKDFIEAHTMRELGDSRCLV